jgi:hypothetical protein
MTDKELKELVALGIESEARELEKLAENCQLSESEINQATAAVWERIQAQIK